MTKNTLALLTVFSLYFTSCSNSPSDIAETSVATYLKENLETPTSYEQISFSQLDTLTNSDVSEIAPNSLYRIQHVYSVINSDQEKVDLSVSFYLDKDLKVTSTDTKNINGEDVLKMAYLFYSGEVEDVLGNDFLFMASTVDFLCYANTQNYWYSDEYTFRDILDDRYRHGYRGLTELQQAINAIDTEEGEVINAISELEEEIIIAQQDIKEKQRAIEDANGMMGMMTYGGVAGIMELSNALSTQEERRAAEEKGRAFPENVKNAFDNLVFHLYAKNKDIAWHIDVLETKTFEVLNPTTEEKHAIRSDIKTYFKEKVGQVYNSNDSYCKDEMVRELLNYYDKEYPIDG